MGALPWLSCISWLLPVSYQIGQKQQNRMKVCNVMFTYLLYVINRDKRMTLP